MPEGGLLHFELNRFLLKHGQHPPIADMEPGEWIRIIVKDNGTGIRTDQLPHIFEPFYSTKPAGQGTGLGLAQVYGIIKQHGGFIDVKSQFGHGTTFTIYLPALTEQKPAASASETPVHIDGVGVTVLVAEDDYATREALQALLEAHRYTVMTAQNGLEALELLEAGQKKIDLIISDVVMPQMGGVALYKAIQERWPEKKILLVTGHPLDSQNQGMLEKGKIAWLQKPFSAQSFNQTVFNLLKN
jgi:CheY-like chemotaxis protein